MARAERAGRAGCTAAEIACRKCGRKQALAAADGSGGVTPERAARLGWLRTVGIPDGGWLCPEHSEARIRGPEEGLWAAAVVSWLARTSSRCVHSECRRRQLQIQAPMWAVEEIRNEVEFLRKLVTSQRR